MVWYTEWFCQTWHASTFQSISFAGRTYHRQESRLHTRPGTLHEGPCLKVVPVMLLPAAPNSYNSALTVAIRHSYLGARLYLLTHRLFKQPPLRTGRARIFSIVFSRSWTPQRVWFWNSGNTTRSQPQSDVTFTGCQSKLVYASRWTSSQEIVLWVKLQSILGRALPSYQRSPGEAQPTIGGTSSALGPSFS